MLKNPWKFYAKAKKNKANLNQSESYLPKRKLTTNLTELGSGNSAKVINLQGSHNLMGKLEAMGIVPGTIILKKSAIAGKGPIIVEKGVVQFAVGYDMAKNILVEPLK
jgi:Fe2+ transport system protein FeoA